MPKLGCILVFEGVLLKWRGAKFVFRREYFCCGGEGALNWRGTIQFMFWITICVLEAIIMGRN